jgi:hypothetical protein
MRHSPDLSGCQECSKSRRSRLAISSSENGAKFGYSLTMKIALDGAVVDIIAM